MMEEADTFCFDYFVGDKLQGNGAFHEYQIHHGKQVKMLSVDQQMNTLWSDMMTRT